MRRLIGAVLAGALGLSVLAVASPAWADPPGCSQGNIALSQSGGYMTAWNNASCSSSATRTFRVEIKRHVTLLPDPVVSSYDDYYTGTLYIASTSSCDGGRSANYYGRSFFTSHPTYMDTGNLLVNTC
ncbi:hypothetical protein EDC02_1365 [Micromonospora sp. Llam0]|uniref:hypothetical protein n=1 Tax=Micromonospora sp. Llam0 TaxID=2485143 RepID=UPI000FA98842|nr:hypothetical protein [Micromonospora sp. Llam0]ROO59565.1 hypothetical protein EDC02_1365 [Micromonospora sp. Llam0]